VGERSVESIVLLGPVEGEEEDVATTFFEEWWSVLSHGLSVDRHWV